MGQASETCLKETLRVALDAVSRTLEGSPFGDVPTSPSILQTLSLNRAAPHSLTSVSFSPLWNWLHSASYTRNICCPKSTNQSAPSSDSSRRPVLPSPGFKVPKVEVKSRFLIPFSCFTTFVLICVHGLLDNEASDG